MTFDSVRRIAMALPGVEEGTSYGTPAFRVRKKLLVRLREDGESVAVKVDFDERDFRMQADPDAFFTTDHYRGYPTVLVSLARVGKEDLQDLLVHAWRRVALKRVVAAYDAVRAGQART